MNNAFNLISVPTSSKRLLCPVFFDVVRSFWRFAGAKPPYRSHGVLKKQ